MRALLEPNSSLFSSIRDTLNEPENVNITSIYFWQKIQNSHVCLQVSTSLLKLSIMWISLDFVINILLAVGSNYWIFFNLTSSVYLLFIFYLLHLHYCPVLCMRNINMWSNKMQTSMLAWLFPFADSISYFCSKDMWIQNQTQQWTSVCLCVYPVIFIIQNIRLHFVVRLVRQPITRVDSGVFMAPVYSYKHCKKIYAFARFLQNEDEARKTT